MDVWCEGEDLEVGEEGEGDNEERFGSFLGWWRRYNVPDVY